MSVPELQFDPDVCASCATIECLKRCQYLDFTDEEAEQERDLLLRGERCRVLEQCATCYACEEYCPFANHPFYRIVDLQEKHGICPVPVPVTNQQIKMMAPRGRLVPGKVTKPVVNMCAFNALSGSIRGKLFEGASTIGGNDIFCNIMWLHFGKSSVIRERLPMVIENIWKHYLEPSGVDELVCFHDECYGTYTHLAPAYGIEVPFKPIHLFEYLHGRLVELKAEIRPLNQKIAYQRPCSSRLVPETEAWLDRIFELIGVERVKRRYDRENALCCAMTIRALQRDPLADDVQERNLDDMVKAGAEYCVFNCPACFFSLTEMVAERGLFPIFVSDLCHKALGEG
jgi:Fe-S oxidoreductase